MHALEQLADYGFAWRDIALSGERTRNHQMAQGRWSYRREHSKIARLLALIDVTSDRFIGEPASWYDADQAGGNHTRMDTPGARSI